MSKIEQRRRHRRTVTLVRILRMIKERLTWVPEGNCIRPPK